MNSRPHSLRCRLLCVLGVLGVLGGCSFHLTACELVQPEVVVRNFLPEPVQITGVSYNGCSWSGILGPGEATSPCACHPGTDHVHFRLFDVQWFVNEVVDAAEEDILDLEPVDDHIGWKLPTPIWHTYRSVDRHRVDYGDFARLDLTEELIEQDFEAPPSYGH